MNQLGLELPGEGRDEPAPKRSAVTDTGTVKARILEALRMERLPAHVTNGQARQWMSQWPEVCDLAFLHAVVNDFAPPFSPGEIGLPTVTHVVYHLIAEGRVVEERSYYGSDQPGSAGYRGFKPVFRLAEGEAA